MLNALLAEEGGGTNSAWMTWVVFGVLIVIIVVFFVFSSRKNKKRQQEAEDLMNAVKPGNKVKTIGGICGIVVEVDPEENTFVLETGSEASGKCYLKFDKQAIYQTDAVVEKKESGDGKGGKDEGAAEKDKAAEGKEPFDETAPAAESGEESAPAEEKQDKE